MAWHVSYNNSTPKILVVEPTINFSEDDAPYDPENNVETIYFNNSRDTNQPALAVKASATATATKVAARGAVINPLDISGISDLVPPPPRIRDPSEEPSGVCLIVHF